MATLTQAAPQQEKEQSHRLRIGASFGLVYLFWGSTYLAIMIAVRHFPPPVLGALRFLIAGALMLGWCAFRRKKLAITRGDFLRLLLVGVLLLVGGNTVLAWAEEYINSGLAAMIVAVVPIWIAMIEALFGGDRLTRLGWSGLLLGIGGLLVLLWPDIVTGNAIGRRDLVASLGLMLGSLSWAVGSVLSRRFQLTVEPFVATGWEMALAGMVNALLAFSLGGFHRADWARTGWLAVGYLVTFGSLVGFTAYIWLLEHVPTPKVATYAYVNPVVAVFLGWLIGGEHIDRYMLLGMVVIVTAVILVTSSKLRSGKLRPERQASPCEAGAD
ncbi:MAG: EamA family transporter [Acidobacteria bacterium]|nr:MAG: EamA family transporter [Acidobacteriota bacterium]PYY19170.1 MAG: EamA family transporter [Acidobacteriota bacterium]